VSTAATRVPLAITVLALALVVESFARRAFRNSRAGLYAALIVLSSPGIFLFTRLTLPDAMVCLWLCGAMYCFWLTEDQAEPERGLCYGFAAACALNVLTKGLIGIVFPVAIVLLFLLLSRGWNGAVKRLVQLHPWTSFTVFLAIAAPWHILIALANPAQGHPATIAYVAGHWQVPLPTDGNVHGWLWFYFVNEQLLRYLNLRVPRDYDTVPLWLFWGLLLIWLMPWSAFLFKTFSGAVRRFRQEPVFILLALWTALPLLFFSLSTRQEYYVLPVLPVVTILIAGWLARDSEVTIILRQSDGPREEGPVLSRETQHILGLVDPEPESIQGPFNLRIEGSETRASAILLAVGSIFAIATTYFLLHTHTPAADTDLATLLQQNPSDYALSMGHFLDLNAQALGLFRVPLILAAAGLFLGPLASYLLRRRAQPHAATLALAAGAFTFLLAAHLGLQTFAPVLSSEQLAAAIAPQLRPDDLIVIHQEYEFASTLGFYLRRNDLHILEGRSSNLWYGSFFPDAPKIFETTQTLAAKWQSPRRVFLWQDLGNQPSALPSLPGEVYVIAKSGGKEIVSNRPNAR
jgi:4-amino-4-deoxy-L-arabinose transferase-like glycosyltransferase